MDDFLEAGRSARAASDTSQHVGAATTAASGDARALADALLADASVMECVVVERHAPSGGRDNVAYVVTADPHGFDELEPRLKALSGGRIAAFVPLFRLPVTDDGTVDHAALARIPVWSDELATACARRIAALPDIDRAACVLRSEADMPRHVHVARLLRDVLPSARGPSPSGSAAISPTAERNAGPAAPSLRHGGDLPPRPDAPQVLSELLQRAPQGTAIVYIDADGAELVTSYGALLQDARHVLGGLRGHGLRPGDKVVLQLDRNDDILTAFWGCLLGGFQPVIVPVPLAYDTDSRALDHLVHIWTLFDRPLVVTTSSRLNAVGGSPLTGTRVAAIEALRGSAADPQVHAAAPNDVAFYTLSSGSTGLPKAVMLTHRNILARARGTSRLCGQSAADVILSWLPFDHIGSISDWHLRCVELGCTLIYAPKEYVLGRPLRWLDLMHRHRVTHSWAPNFAYALVSAALKGEPQRDWDLSGVRMLLTAGESVTRSTTREFLDCLAPYGLQPPVLQTAFGMAEVGSGVTYHRPAPGRTLTFHHVDRNTLGGTLRPVDPADSSAVSFASLGPVIPGTSMRIVDEEQRIVPEGTTGRLHFSGEAVSPGYYNNPEANAVFHPDGWFDTGDVGFITGGELMLTGRADAGIIINGANFYNNEIEAVVEHVDGVTESFTAACAVRPPDSDAQKLAVFFHTPFDDDAVLRKLLKAIQLRLTKQLGIKADYLIPVDQGAIPKTGIGKIQRKRLIDQFQTGAFHDVLERLDVLARNEHTLPDRFTKKIWQRKELIHGPRTPRGSCLVFLDRHGLGRQIVAALEALGVPCVTVSAGEALAQRGPADWTVRPDEPQDYRAPLKSLSEAGVALGAIVHLFSIDADRDAEQRLGFDSLLALAQVLAAHQGNSGLRLLAVSSGAQAIDGRETCSFANATIPGLLQSIAQELPGLRAVHVDVRAEAGDSDASRLVRELLTPSADHEVAYRGGERWVSGLQRVAVAARPDTAAWKNPLRRQGVYVLNNGLDGIGPHLAEFLLTQFDARVLLLGRDKPPTPAVDRLRDMGGECAYAAADPRDADALRYAIETHVARWGGELDGVIHVPAMDHSRGVLKESQAALSAAVEENVSALRRLSEIARQRRDCALIILSSAADVPGAAGACAPDVRACNISLAALEDMGANPSAATVRQSLNSLLVGLRLGERHLLIGLDDANPAVRARLLDGPPQAQKPAVCFTAGRLISRDELHALPLHDRYGSPVDCDTMQMREAESAAREQIELWPSVAEYFVYDDLIYYALANDERRNQKYRAALERTAPGKIVLDIGTGKEAILARLALAAGARKVYAIEKGDDAFAQAVANIRKLGLEDRITVIHGDASTVQLPEPADVCVSEIVGPIGGCEGAAVVINDAQRFLRPGGVMIPVRSLTQIAAVRLPDTVLTHPGFYRVPGSYTEKIFAEIGYPFDLRVCVKKFPATHLLSNAAAFEDLDFSRSVPVEQQHDIELTIDQASRLDGFLVWLNLHTIAGEVIDILEHEHSWLPVYLPVFDPGVDVGPGDRIRATVTRVLSDNGLNPDYVIAGTLVRSTGESVPFTHESYHHVKRFKQHPFYERLFREDTYGCRPGGRPGNALHYLPEMPLTATGDVDVPRLRRMAQGQDEAAAPRQAPASDIERQIAQVWQDVLGVAEVGIHDNFFELGGDSLLLVQAHNRLGELFGSGLTLVDLFKYPTIHALVQALRNETPQRTASQAGAERAQARSRIRGASGGMDIAVIGIACRFPGADGPDAFWRNLAAGTESITFFSEPDVIASGVDPAVARHPAYVRASPILSDIEGFDAEFFGYAAQEATLMDPQQRLLLECGWEALENAGYDPFNYPGGIGVYAGASMNTYLLNNVYPSRDTLDAVDSLNVTTLDSMGGFQLMVANDKDYLPTRLSYKLNLRGPSINVQTACSTGLVAVHLACQALLNGEADMFLAAGSSVQVPHRAGHLFQDGMIVSPDGHCRAFDAKAKGTVFGSGVGVVVLKRLEDAIRDRDHVVAVVKGSAVNNDGGVKAGYMAPSSEGQAAVVAEALAVADVPPDTIGFVEAHGTGTEMGDPIEVNALTQAYRAHTEQKGFCAIGSVKTNVGHLQIASGMVGFIKTVLALQHRMIPPSLHFEAPNPAIDFANSPFYVGTRLTPWKSERGPRRAGVNSLGIGGTNAHVILEEAPAIAAAENAPERSRHILLLSARNDTALAQLAGRYGEFLAENPDIALADVCFTANTGRKPFDRRLAIVAGSTAQLLNDLRAMAGGQARAIRGQASSRGRGPLAFLFTGQGSQYVGMGRELYETQPGFRRHLDHCAEILRPLLDRPLLDVLYPADRGVVDLHETAYTQPALFAMEYALAELWKSWGISPAAVMGHSLGEYVAACVAGVFGLEDALKLVAARARLMQALPRDGKMAAVFAGAAKVEPFVARFSDDVAVAAENGPNHTVISGRTRAVDEICARLRDAGVTTQPLKTSHAFHSPLMQPMLADFARIAGQIAYAAPRLDIVSNVTGEIITEEIATPDYWCRHIAQPVRFLAGMRAMAGLGCETFVEIGPKPTLLGLGAGCLSADSALWLPSLNERQGDWQQLLESLARLAVRGPVNWTGFEQDYRRRRVPLPTYPFQRQRYWLDRPAHSARPAAARERSRGGASPLLGERLPLPTLKTTVYQTQFDPRTLPLLRDHRIFGEIVVSAACHVSLLLAAARQTFGDASCTLKDVYFLQPLIVRDEQPPVVQVVLNPSGDSTSLQVVSFAPTTADGDGGPKASVHVEAALHRGPAAARSANDAKQAVWQRCPTQLSADVVFQTQAERQIELGPSYRWIKTIQVGDGEAVCNLHAPAALGGLEARPLHPGMLDAGFGLLLATAPLEPGDTWLPFRIAEVRLHQEPEPDRCWAHLVLRKSEDAHRVVADVRLCDEHGQVCLEFVGLEGRRVSRADILRDRPDAARGLLYRKQWQPIAAPPRPAATGPAPQWLIFADAQGIGDHLAQRLRRDARCVVVTAGDAFRADNRDRYHLNPLRPTDFDRLLRESAGADSGYDGIVHLWSLDEPGLETAGRLADSQHLTCASSLHLVQALAKAGAIAPGRLWLVTRGAQPAGDFALRETPGREPAGPALQQVPLWGLGRTIALEHPELRCTSLDLDPGRDPADIADLLDAIRSADDEPEVAWRQSVRYVARLIAQPDAVTGGRLSLQPTGSYLITGGTGGLGLRTAEWLVAQGARHLALVSRHPPSAAALALIEQLKRAGADVQVMQADVADRGAMRGVFETMRATMPTLRGVIHAAGGIEDRVLFEQDWQLFRSVFAAKIDGAWNLHELTEHGELDFFVLFSSAAAVLGSQGQANYAAANAFLDGLAHYRHARGLPATSINWGPWDQVGLAMSNPAIQERMRRLGFAGIKPEDGLALLGQILRAPTPQVSVIDCNWPTYLAQLATPQSLFSELRLMSKSVVHEPSPGPAPDMRLRLRHASAAERRQILSDVVHGAVRQVLGLRDGMPLDVDSPLTEQGLDSLMATQLRNSLANSLGQPLPVSLVFNYPTVTEMVGYLEAQSQAQPAGRSPEPAAAADGQPDDEPPQPRREESAAHAARELLADLDELLADQASGDGNE